MVKPDPQSPQPGKTDPNAEVADLRFRLDALKAELGDAVAAEKAGGATSRSGQASSGALGVGMRAGSELVAGVLVGCGIGYLIDRQFDVSPLFLIVFMMMGMAAGFWNIYRMGARSTGGSTGDKN